MNPERQTWRTGGKYQVTSLSFSPEIHLILKKKKTRIENTVYIAKTNRITFAGRSRDTVIYV
jgi:hypothetical protein